MKLLELAGKFAWAMAMAMAMAMAFAGNAFGQEFPPDTVWNPAGSTKVEGYLDVTSLSSFEDLVTVKKGLTASGPLLVNDSLTVSSSGSLFLNGPLSLRGTKVDVDTKDGTLTVNGVRVGMNGGAGSMSSLSVGQSSSFMGNVGVGQQPDSFRLSVKTSQADDGIVLTGKSGSDWVKLLTNISPGAHNPITKSGDRGLVYEPSGGFVIAPLSGTKSGMRFDGNGNVSIGTEVCEDWYGAPVCFGVAGDLHADKFRDNQGFYVLDPSDYSYLNNVNVWGSATLYHAEIYGGNVYGNLGFGLNYGEYPEFPIHIKTYSQFPMTSDYTYQNGSGWGRVNSGTSQNMYVSLWADQRIVTGAEVDVLSDVREKNVVGPIDPQKAAEKIRRLEPKTYTWKDGHEPGVKTGFIAQEVDKVAPEAVSKIEARGFKDLHVLNYDTLYTLNVAATKHLLEIVEKQQAMLTKQQSEIDELKAQVAKARR